MIPQMTRSSDISVMLLVVFGLSLIVNNDLYRVESATATKHLSDGLCK